MKYIVECRKKDEAGNISGARFAGFGNGLPDKKMELSQMTHIQAFCQRTGRSTSETCAYTLDREVMAAWRRWMKAGPETEGAARKEYEAAQQVLNEYGDAWEADQARKEQL